VNFILGGLYALCGVIMTVAIGFLANLIGGAVQEAGGEGDGSTAWFIFWTLLFDAINL